MKFLAWYIDMNGIEKNYTVKYKYPTKSKKWKILITNTQMVSKKDDTSSTPVYTKVQDQRNSKIEQS